VTDVGWRRGRRSLSSAPAQTKVIGEAGQARLWLSWTSASTNRVAPTRSAGEDHGCPAGGARMMQSDEPRPPRQARTASISVDTPFPCATMIMQAGFRPSHLRRDDPWSIVSVSPRRSVALFEGAGARFEKKCPVSVAFKGGVRSGQLLLVGPKSGRVITTIQKCEKAASVGDIVILATDFLVHADVHYAFPFGPLARFRTAPTAPAEPAGEPSDCCHTGREEIAHRPVTP